MKKFLLLLHILNIGITIPAVLAQDAGNPKHSSSNETRQIPTENTDAQFPGGNIALSQFISNNLNYPEEAAAHNISGRVIVKFIVDDSGNLKRPEIIKGLGYGCDEEVLRVMALSPKWEPASQNGKPIKARIQMPVNFNLMAVPGNAPSDIANLSTIPPPTTSDRTYPEFPGGAKKLKHYIGMRIKFPKEMRKKAIRNRVIAEFTIDEHGKPGDFKIIKGAGRVFDKEVLRVLRDMPDWKPGTENGKPVKMYYSLPVNFRTY